nr:MAG TPA: hypothetical protein [Caudoviricetes sp.]
MLLRDFPQYTIFLHIVKEVKSCTTQPISATRKTS